ncbi:MAG: hypothetical protein PHF86_14750 [Candidatus Nanoarchaeia archaeon]|nr:hypothetical protein [Candidatus Nanoarchaeia archaeon]
MLKEFMMYKRLDDTIYRERLLLTRFGELYHIGKLAFDSGDYDIAEEVREIFDCYLKDWNKFFPKGTKPLPLPSPPLVRYYPPLIGAWGV